MAESPYEGVSPERWPLVTKRLIRSHPLKPKEIVEGTLLAWRQIFASDIGGFRIGLDINPKPQIMGFLLHELIPLHFQARYPNTWRCEKAATEKDLVYLPDSRYSVEIKTSSNPSKLFGNRSYAQPGDKPKKDKSGYYLGVNFGKFKGDVQPEVHLIRFGWLDHHDWLGQKAATGQQASLNPLADQFKLLVLYRVK